MNSSRVFWGTSFIYLLHINAVAGAGEDQGCPHGLGKASCLVILVRTGEGKRLNG